MLLIGLGTLCGLVVLVLVVVLVFMGVIRSALVRQSFNGAIYVETFAIWLIAFLGLQIVGALLQGIVGKVP